MASSYTTNNDIEKPGIGEAQGVWGNIINTDLDKLDAAIGKVITVNAVGNPTLTTSQSGVAQFDSAVIRLTGDISSTGQRTVTMPSNKHGVFIIDTYGLTFGANSVRIKTAGETNGVVITSVTDKVLAIYTNGTSVRAKQNATSPFILNEIRMYAPSGAFTSAALPAGWHVCNGQNGTPDLRTRFILGAPNHTTWHSGSKTGGSNSVQVSANSLTVTGNTGSTTLTEAMIPQHKHPQFNNTTVNAGTNPSPTITSNPAGTVAAGRTNVGDNGEYYMANAAGTATVGYGGYQTGSQSTPATHNHSIQLTVTGPPLTIPTVPVYYSLILIQYKGV